MFAFTLFGLEAQGNLVLTFGGDLMAHDVNYKMPDYNNIYDDVREFLHTDDLSFVNLEFPVDDSKPFSSYPSFNTQSPYVEAAIRGGFDAFSLANNHSNDRGISSIIATQNAMDRFNRAYRVMSDGLRRNTSHSFNVVMRKVKGTWVGLMAGTNLLNQPAGQEYIRFLGWRNHFNGVTNQERVEAFLQDVRDAAVRVDFLVVSIHDGIEYGISPLEGQKAFYKRIIESGANVVWVQHPHVLNPWQKVGDGLILYSMGNFISGQRHMLSPSQWNEYRAERGDGALIRVRFFRTGSLWRMEEPQTQFITHYRQNGQGWVVKRLPQLLSTLQDNDPWKDYYTRRYGEMVKRFVSMPRAWIWEQTLRRGLTSKRFSRL